MKNGHEIANMEVEFSGGDKLRLTAVEKACYAGFVPGPLIEVSYGERIEGRYEEDHPSPGLYHYFSSGIRYFPADRMDCAMDFFNKQALSGRPFDETHRAMFRLEDCLVPVTLVNELSGTSIVDAYLDHKSKIRATDQESLRQYNRDQRVICFVLGYLDGMNFKWTGETGTEKSAVVFHVLSVVSGHTSMIEDPTSELDVLKNTVVEKFMKLL